MLVILHKGQEAKAEAIFKKWELTYANIGEITDTGRVQYYMNGVLEADIPAESLALGGGAPVYTREWEEPAYFAEIKKYNMSSIADISMDEAVKAANFLVQQPNIASKRWVFNQYDSMVGTVNQSTNKPSDAAIVRVKGSVKSLALTVDCNSRYVYADPETGCAIAVAEAARNIVCSGGKPSAVTNCLNFGNPYDKAVYYQFKHSIDGMGKACLKFGTPVTGGNVSFYNQSTDGTAVYPTPTIGMVGIVEQPEHHMTLDFKQEGDLIYLLGESQDDISSSQYLAKYHKVAYSPAPHFNLDTEYDLQQNTYALIIGGLVQSCHDISEGGLFVTLFESGQNRNLGFNISSDSKYRKDAWLFGESQSRIVVSVKPENKAVFEKAVSGPFTQLGTVSGTSMVIDGTDFGSVADCKNLYDNAIEKAIS